MYQIKEYSYNKAKLLNVKITPSTRREKIGVYKSGDYIASIDALGMNDYPTYIRKFGITFAKTRRRLYKKRHEKDRHKRLSKGWLADKLLW